MKALKNTLLLIASVITLTTSATVPVENHLQGMKAYPLFFATLKSKE